MLELWFDFSCPFAYLASRRAMTLPVPIDWRPMLLGGVFRGTGAGDGPMATLSPQKARHNLADMHRWAALFGTPFRMPDAHPMRTILALRTLLALPREVWPTAIHAIYAAYWERGEDVAAEATLRAALAGAGIDAGVASAALAAAGSDAIKDELRRRTDEAVALGIFGAPTWVFRDGRAAPALIWGQDRMPWVEAAIAGWDPDGGATWPRTAVGDDPRTGRPTDAAGIMVRSASPRSAGDGHGRAVPGAAVDVYVDVASPFAYLGLTQLAALEEMGAAVRLVPILLGGLFRDLGQHDVPLRAFVPAKMRYVERELQRWARWWGVPFAMPAKFPQRTIAAQRLLLVAEAAVQRRLALALARAMWAEQRDLEDEATLRAILDGAGAPAALLERTRDPDVKAQLAANTTAAREAGVFGVPTFVTHTPIGPRLFWGQDRLDLVARTLAGWNCP